MSARRIAIDNRWTLAILFAAMLLPTVIFAALQIGFSYRAERRYWETNTLARADAIMAAVDGSMERSRGAALALGTSVSIRAQDWHAADARARQIADLNPDWRTVRLVDVVASREILDTSRPFGPPRPIAPLRLRADASVRQDVAFGGMVPGPRGCPCLSLSLPIVRDGAVRYLLTILVSPLPTQALLVARAPKEGTSAVVDRDGNFIARTRDFRHRVGTPATIYVRNAIRSGTDGSYASVTYEGLVSYTAFATSPLTGWSAHIAVPSARLELPVWRSQLATTVAVLASILLAIGLGWVLVRMIAAQRAADVRLQQAQRLEAVGKMTGGIAHDFNNMLAIVIGSLDLAQHRLKAGRTDVARNIDNAMDGARRAAELTRRLLAFSRRQTLAPAHIDVNALLRDMTELLRQTVTESVRLEFACADAPWPAFVDPGQLENAIINVAANARDAMPGGGRLTIATANEAVPADRVAQLDLRAGDYVRIAMTDTGTGMSTETAKRAFEPFFTTKEVGRGTGLGLSQIYGFLDQSGGRAHIRSAPGEGTTIELYLPRGAEAADAAGTPAQVDTPVPRGAPDEIILVAEDEAQVRRTSVEALRELGYTVRHAADGAEALAMLDALPGVRLLFTDIVMPGMNGRDLARTAQQRNPALRVLFATGYEPGADAAAEDATLLLKPFAFDRLARKVRAVLDA